MNTQYEIHPLSIRVFDDKCFFQQPQPDLLCQHCTLPCDQEPPVSLPTPHHDTNMFSAFSKEALAVQYRTMYVHGLYCSLECVKAIASPKVFERFNQMVWYSYNIKLSLEIRRALPFWCLEKYGGSMTSEEYRQFNKSGILSERLVQELGIETNPNQQPTPLDESDCFEYTELDVQHVELTIQLRHPYKNKLISTPQQQQLDSFWHKPLPNDTKLCCWYDAHSLAGIAPTFAVLDYDQTSGVAIKCEGVFCSVECQLSYVLDLEGMHMWQRVYWNRTVYAQHFGQDEYVVSDRSPDRRLLKAFGGITDVDEYRDGKSSYKTIVEPPVGCDFGNLFARFNNMLNPPMWTVTHDTQEFHVLSLLHRTMGVRKLKMNGDQYDEGIRHFDRVVHCAKPKDELRLHFVLMLLSRKQDSLSNADILKAMQQDENFDPLSKQV